MKMTKADAKNFDRRAINALAGALGVPDKTVIDAVANGSRFTFITDCGSVEGKFFPSDNHSGKRGRWHRGWMHFRFNDLTLARKRFGTDPIGRLNPYSGKWNWMFSDDSIIDTPEIMANSLKFLNARDLEITHE